MKNTILLQVAILVSGAYVSNAQLPEEFIVNKGEVAVEIIPVEEQYRFPEFQEGQVVLYNEELMPAIMNYNHLYGEIHFLNDVGDTLSLGNPDKLKYIQIGNEVFYYANREGFIEVLQDYPAIKLGMKQILTISKSEVKLSRNNRDISVGGSDIRGTAPAGDVRETFNEDKLTYRDFYTRKTPGKLVFARQVSYFFIDKNNHIHPAKPSAIYKIFRREKDAVKKYVDDYKINFKKEEDLKMLLEFCSRQGTTNRNASKLNQTPNPADGISYFISDDRPGKNTPAKKGHEEMKVHVKVSFPSVPDFIVFRNIHNLSGGSPVNKQAEQAQKRMLAYLDKKDIFYEKDSEGMLEINEGEELAWQYYKIKMSYMEYLLFKQEFSAHKGVGLLPLEIYFKEKDRKKLNRMVLDQAEFKADLVAKEKKVMVGRLISMEEPESDSGWQVYPPASADYNYFDARLEGEYIVKFEVLPQ